jgi:beta-1,4-mannosyl-glycoprotein beta-1,4-N-acetylglucosaminyltransferase
MGRVFDCFTFFNELDLLEFRLRFLNDYVDFFVITESDYTHSGKPKPFYFEANKKRFEAWNHKIIYLPIKQSIDELIFESHNTYNPESAAWKLENEQRNALLGAYAFMNENDFVLISDLDEIPDPSFILKIKYAQLPVSFSLLFHYYFLNAQNTGESRWWKGCIAATAVQFKTQTPQGLRNLRDDLPSFANAGWHFSFLGGVKKIKEKIAAFAHTEFQKEEFMNEEQIEEALRSGKDILKREGVQFEFLPLSFYPKRLQKVMKLFPALLHLPERNIFSDIYYTMRRISKNNY